MRLRNGLHQIFLRVGKSHVYASQKNSLLTFHLFLMPLLLRLKTISARKVSLLLSMRYWSLSNESGYCSCGTNSLEAQVRDANATSGILIF